MPEEDKKQFIDFRAKIIKNNKMKIEVYKQIIPVCWINLGSIEENELENERLKILVENKTIKFNDNNLQIIYNQIPEILDVYINNNIELFINGIESYTINENMICDIIKSPIIKFREKNKIINSIDTSYINEESMEYIINNYSQNRISKINEKLDVKIENGKITKIEKDSRKYLNFIRKSHNKELNLDDIRDITITPSQVDLLLLELKRIQYNLTTHPKKELYERADIVNELLRTIPLAKPVTNNSVGIGTVFDLTVTVNGEERIYPSIELINCAITDEFEGEYLEKSSELGTCLFGLTENESFTYMSCEGQVVGKVSNIINNQKVNENSNINHKIYHK